MATVQPALVDNADATDNELKQYSMVQRIAMSMARRPKTYFWVAFIIAFALSAFGMIVGEFSVSNEEGGWQSRGTLIADRTTQIMVAQYHQEGLFMGDEEVWEDLITNVQPGWEVGGEDDDEEEGDRRRLQEQQKDNKSWLEGVMAPKFMEPESQLRQSLPLAHENNSLQNFLTEKFQQDNSRRLEGCSVEQLAWYFNGNMTAEERLWPVWKTNSPETTALSPSIVEELCVNEQQTQSILEQNGLCLTCDGSVAAPGSSNVCMPPYGIVLYARLLVEGGMDMDCPALAQAWEPLQAQTETEWTACVEYMEANPTSVTDGSFLGYCPAYFHPAILDEMFDSTGNVQYTSSVFATNTDMVEDLYDLVDQYGKGGDEIEGAYDTQGDEFLRIFSDGVVNRDMLLACGSAIITTIAIFVHTRSLFLTVVGVVQIILSFPLAFFAYRFLGGFTFFPFLNFIGVFVVFALGADHVFVAVDKWKNARLDHPKASTEQVAAKALPDAASAMMLTTSTTAAAFFGTAICPVAPVRLFALFCGMLITFDYVMDVLLIFPALCIYDGYRFNPNCCIVCCNGKKNNDETEEEAEESDEANQNKAKNISTRTAEQTQDYVSGDMSDESGAANNEEPMRLSFIRRILLGYYNFLHKVRWPLLTLCLVALAVSARFAFKLSLPTDNDVRLVTDNVEYERSYQWRQNLLSTALRDVGGSLAVVAWGLSPADTGDLDDPESWSQLVLDDSFDPSSTEAQEYLRDYCPSFFNQSFADYPYEGYECSMNKFDDWLQQESAAAALNGNVSAVYVEYCNGASQLPMDSNAFSPCIIAWSRAVGEYDVLARDGAVEIILFSFTSRVRYDSPNSELDAEWHLIEGWMDNANENAPAGAGGAFFSSMDFWWYDTNLQMFKTAYGSAAIAIAASAVVILLSSRSLVMTLFSVLSIGYVLGSVTSMMVAAGWTLGFLEAVCFAILIGVSVDFVIHFSHAYVAMPGKVPRDVRTKHALIDMGPSILAAAFTTIAGAGIMLFCVIIFFTKFAFVLFFAIIQATIGSFVFFLTLTDCIGPEEPTYMADLVVKQCKGETDEIDVGETESDQPAAGKKDLTATTVPSGKVLPLSLIDNLDDEIEV